MKKFIAGIISISILITSCYGISSVFADESSKPITTSQKSNLENVLLKVKGKIPISDKFTKFTNNINYDKETGKSTYYFNWSTEEKDSNLYANITADENGNIFSYNTYNSNWNFDNNMKISKFSKAEVKIIIDEMLKNIIPEKVDKLVYTNSTSYGDSFNFTYERQENGIDVVNDNVHINANVVDGQIVLTSLNVNWTDGEFLKSKNNIDINKAVSLYKEKSNLELRYKKDYRTDNVYLEYGFKNDDIKFIDATTGELVEYNNFRPYPMYSKEMSTMGSAKDSELSPIEIDEIDKIAGLMSVSDMEKKIRSINEINISDKQTLDNYRIYRVNDDYFCNLSFSEKSKIEGEYPTSSAYATMNAKTGEIYDINAYVYIERKDDYKIKIATDSEKKIAQQRIEEFLEKYSLTHFNQTKLNETNEYDGVVTFNYVNMINNIPYYNNYISISYDTKTSKVLNMYTSWEDLKNVQKPDGIIGIDTAYETIIKNADFDKLYIILKKVPTIVYTIKDTNNIRVNAKSGKMINYNGSEYIAGSVLYTDIKGHWAENIINSLSENGIKLTNGKFKLDDQIVQKDYLELLYKTMYRRDFSVGIPDYKMVSSKFRYDGNVSDIYIDDIYNVMIQNGVITKDEKAPEKPVTKEQAIVYLLRMMGFAKAADIKGIYICDFKDKDDISADKLGYVAIAKGLGIVNGDSDNEFLPTKTMSHAEASTVIYNYMSK